MKNYIINALVKLWKRGSRLMVVSKDVILHIANLADLNIKDFNGKTAKDHALLQENKEMIELLTTM